MCSGCSRPTAPRSRSSARAAAGARAPAVVRAAVEPSAIATIAYDVGFGDLSYFNRRFRRQYGMTPREVRGDKNT